MLKYVRGWFEIQIKGADPEHCLTALTEADVAFWDLKKIDAFTFQCLVYESDLTKARNAAQRRQCEIRTVRRNGFRSDFSGLKRRPILVLGVLAAMLAALWLQNYMWFFKVEGAQKLEETTILRILEENGVGFGRWGVGLNTETVKNRMLLRLPELRWLAVNREGGIVTVLVSERERQVPLREARGVCNVVAARDGIVTRMDVYSGLSAAAPGDAVHQGQLLVSGLIDCPTHTQAVHAEAEVYAKTLRCIETCTMSEYSQKTYTGRTEQCVSLIFQRNRRKISGNSSIFGGMCDKMIERWQIALPCGWKLPLWIETETLYEYELSPSELDSDLAQSILQDAAAAEAIRQTVAGRILSASFETASKDGVYRCNAQLFCSELISKTVPVYLFGEEEENGEIDQRRTD